MIAPKGLLISAMLLLVLVGAADSADAYKVVPGDLIRISVFGQNDLDSVSRVGEQGTITFNPVGQIKVGGLSEYEIERLISARLQERGIINSAQVKVSVEEFNRPLVAVLGHVNRPGEYPIDPDTTVVQMVARAGGMSPDAGHVAVLTRGGAGIGSQTIEVDVTEILGGGASPAAIRVSAGDTIFVPPAPVIYVYGEVNRPGSYRLERGMRVMQAISVAGGISPKGTTRGLTVTRTQGGQSKTTTIQLADELMANDVVHIKESLF